MDDPNCERIAHRSTRGEGRFAKSRWAELSVYYMHQVAPGGRRWYAETTGKSSIDGETDRRNLFGADSLALALAHFDDTAPARAVKEQAQAWLADNHDTVERDRTGFNGTTDAEAIDWLYGMKRPSLDAMRRLSEDFGMVKLAEGTVMVPLAAAAVYIDLASFRWASEQRLKAKGEQDNG